MFVMNTNQNSALASHLSVSSRRPFASEYAAGANKWKAPCRRRALIADDQSVPAHSLQTVTLRVGTQGRTMPERAENRIEVGVSWY